MIYGDKGTEYFMGGELTGGVPMGGVPMGGAPMGGSGDSN